MVAFITYGHPNNLAYVRWLHAANSCHGVAFALGLN